MVDIVALKKKIDDSGIPMTTIAKRACMVRETLYNRLSGIGEFTASEIYGLTKALCLTRKERDDIFFSSKV